MGNKAFRPAEAAPNANPLIKKFIDLRNVARTSWNALGDKVGCNAETFWNWTRDKKPSSPDIYLFDCALNALGYKLAIVPLEENNDA